MMRKWHEEYYFHRHEQVLRFVGGEDGMESKVRNINAWCVKTKHCSQRWKKFLGSACPPHPQCSLLWSCEAMLPPPAELIERWSAAFSVCCLSVQAYLAGSSGKNFRHINLHSMHRLPFCHWRHRSGCDAMYHLLDGMTSLTAFKQRRSTIKQTIGARQ
jgi:hypothetical protein